MFGGDDPLVTKVIVAPTVSHRISRGVTQRYRKGGDGITRHPPRRTSGYGQIGPVAAKTASSASTAPSSSKWIFTGDLPLGRRCTW